MYGYRGWRQYEILHTVIVWLFVLICRQRHGCVDVLRGFVPVMDGACSRVVGRKYQPLMVAGVKP